MTKLKSIVSYAVLIIASFLSAFPLYYMLCGATNSSIDVVRGKLYPGIHLIENFKTLVGMQNLGLAMYNSFRKCDHHYSCSTACVFNRRIWIRDLS